MCGPKFCSTKITQDIRDYAKGLNEKQAGMDEMREKFNAMGQQVYVDADKVISKFYASKSNPPPIEAIHVDNFSFDVHIVPPKKPLG